MDRLRCVEANAKPTRVLFHLSGAGLDGHEDVDHPGFLELEEHLDALTGPRRFVEVLHHRLQARCALDVPADRDGLLGRDVDGKRRFDLKQKNALGSRQT